MNSTARAQSQRGRCAKQNTCANGSDPKVSSIKYGGDGGNGFFMLLSVVKAAPRSGKHDVSQAVHQRRCRLQRRCIRPRPIMSEVPGLGTVVDRIRMAQTCTATAGDLPSLANIQYNAELKFLWTEWGIRLSKSSVSHSR